MYRILIADDELQERTVIRYLLDQFGFELDIAEAANGKEAWTILEKERFDILFTDIKMPFLTGIDLAAKARSRFPELRIIFFSGFDDFEFVKEALSLRAVNYILKPVNPDEFRDTIGGVIDSIHSDCLEKEQQRAALGFVKNHILYQLINNTPMDTLKRTYSSFDFSFVYRYRRLLLIQLDIDFFYFSPEKIDFRFPEGCDFINLNPSQSLLLFSEQACPFHWYREEAEKLHTAIQNAYGLDSFLAVSMPFLDPDDIGAAYEEAEQFLENRFFFNDRYFFAGNGLDDDASAPEKLDDALIGFIEKDVQFKDTVGLWQHVNLLLHKYEARPGSHIYVRFLYTSLLRVLLQNLPDYDEQAVNQLAEQVFQVRHFAEIRLLVEQTTERLVLFLEREQPQPNHAIRMAEDYIRTHFKDELSLNMLAEKVYLSPRYLSTLFIQEKGCGINKFIKMVRMDKAKEMLIHTNLKVNEVCREVGYSNLSYFCKSFQENFGTTPEKFRQNSETDDKRCKAWPDTAP